MFKWLFVLCLSLGDSLLRDRASRSADTCLQKYAESLENVSQGLGAHVRQIRVEPPVLSEREIVFGAGSGTTATRSLHHALRILGMNGWHWSIDSHWTQSLMKMLCNDDTITNWTIPRRMVPCKRARCFRDLATFDFTSLPSNVEYVLDEPVGEILVHLLAAFPNAKIIMTTRPSLEWVSKRRLHHHALAPLQDPCNYHVEDFPDDRVLARLEDLKHELVRCIVPRDRLLEFSVFSDPPEQIRALMGRIGRFVGRPVAEGRRFPGSSLLEGLLPEERVAALGVIKKEANYSAPELGEVLQRLAKQGALADEAPLL